MDERCAAGLEEDQAIEVVGCALGVLGHAVPVVHLIRNLRRLLLVRVRMVARWMDGRIAVMDASMPGGMVRCTGELR